MQLNSGLQNELTENRTEVNFSGSYKKSVIIIVKNCAKNVLELKLDIN